MVTYGRFHETFKSILIVKLGIAFSLVKTAISISILVLRAIFIQTISIFDQLYCIT